MCLREMYILLLLEGIFYISLLRPPKIKNSSNSVFPHNFLYGGSIYSWKWVLRFPTISILSSIPPIKFVIICQIYVGSLILGVYAYIYTYMYLKLYYVHGELIFLALHKKHLYLLFHFLLKIYFVWYKHSYPCSFLI